MRVIIKKHSGDSKTKYYLVVQSLYDHPFMASINSLDKLKLLSYARLASGKYVQLLSHDKADTLIHDFSKQKQGVLHLFPVSDDLVVRYMGCASAELANLLLDLTLEELEAELCNTTIENTSAEQYISFISRCSSIAAVHFRGHETLLPTVATKTAEILDSGIDKELLEDYQHTLAVQMLLVYRFVEKEDIESLGLEVYLSLFYQSLTNMFTCEKFSYYTDQMLIDRMWWLVRILQQDKDFCTLRKSSQSVQRDIAKLALLAVTQDDDTSHDKLRTLLHDLYQSLFAERAQQCMLDNVLNLYHGEPLLKSLSPFAKYSMLRDLLAIIDKDLIKQAKRAHCTDMLRLNFFNTSSPRALLFYREHCQQYLERLRRHAQLFMSAESNHFYAAIPASIRIPLVRYHLFSIINNVFSKNKPLPRGLLVELLHNLYSFDGVCGMLTSHHISEIQESLFKYLLTAEEPRLLKEVAARLNKMPVVCDQRWSSSDKVNYKFSLDTQDAISAESSSFFSSLTDKDEKDTQPQRYQLVFHVTHGIQSLSKRNGFKSRLRLWRRYNCPITIAVGVPHAADHYIWKYKDKTAVYEADFIDYFTCNSEVPGLTTKLVAWQGIIKVWQFEYDGTQHYVLNIPYPDGCLVELDSHEIQFIYDFVDYLYQQPRWRDADGKMHIHSHCKWGVERGLIVPIFLRAAFNHPKHDNYQAYINSFLQTEDNSYDPNHYYYDVSSEETSETEELPCNFIEEVAEQIELPINSGGIEFQRFLPRVEKRLNIRELVGDFIYNRKYQLVENIDVTKQDKNKLTGLQEKLELIGKALDRLRQDYGELLCLMSRHGQHRAYVKVLDYIYKHAQSLAAKSAGHKQVVAYFLLLKYSHHLMLARDEPVVNQVWQALIKDPICGESLELSDCSSMLKL